MRIIVLGASGMVGRAVLQEAIGREHTVTGVARRRPDPAEEPGIEAGTGAILAWHTLDVADEQALGAVMEGVDAAVLSIRMPQGQEDSLAPLSAGVLRVAASTGARLVIIGGAAPLRSPRSRDLLVIDDETYVPVAWKAVAGASLAQLRSCQEQDYQGWTYISPPADLGEGPRTGRYVRGADSLLVDQDARSWISVPDLAVAVLDEIECPSGGQHLTFCGSTVLVTDPDLPRHSIDRPTGNVSLSLNDRGRCTSSPS